MTFKRSQRNFSPLGSRMLIVMTTVPSLHESDVMAVKIIESKLAACVQILPPMTSVYVWEGKVNKESEHL
ncbi:MAG: divalent-cation tolerance protein CutA, partial [Pyrinomonadaceae bacterium]|nr:divalent-cation tolerance protein CutA [Pyrinomonadaceae bacterium]